MTLIKQNFMKPNEIFKKWMNSIPYGLYNDVRKRVIEECKIEPGTYSNWRNGTCSIPLLAQEKIEVLSAEYAVQRIGVKITFDEKETAQVEK